MVGEVVVDVENVETVGIVSGQHAHTLIVVVKK